MVLNYILVGCPCAFGPSFSLFQKMRVLGDLAIIAITCPFGHFWSRCLRLILLQSLQFKCIVIRAKCHLRQSAFGPFKRGLFFGRFLKNFSWSPFCTFLENAGFGWPCQNSHNFFFFFLIFYYYFFFIASNTHTEKK